MRLAFIFAGLVSCASMFGLTTLHPVGAELESGKEPLLDNAPLPRLGAARGALISAQPLSSAAARSIALFAMFLRRVPPSRSIALCGFLTSLCW